MNDGFPLERLAGKLATIHIIDRDRRKIEELYTEACNASFRLLTDLRLSCHHDRVLHIRSDVNFCNEGIQMSFGSVLVSGPQRICLDCGIVEKCRLPDNAVELDRHELAERFGKEFDTGDVRATLQQEAESKSVFHELSGEPARTIQVEEFLKLFGEHPADRYRKTVHPEELYTLWMTFGRPKDPTSPHSEEACHGRLEPKPSTDKERFKQAVSAGKRIGEKVSKTLQTKK